MLTTSLQAAASSSCCCLRRVGGRAANISRQGSIDAPKLASPRGPDGPPRCTVPSEAGSQVLPTQGWRSHSRPPLPEQRALQALTLCQEVLQATSKGGRGQGSALPGAQALRRSALRVFHDKSWSPETVCQGKEG